MLRGFVCVSTLDRFDELKRFLHFFQKHNSLPMSILLAKDIADAHRIKTKIAWLTPFEYTVFLDTDMLVNGDLSELFKVAISAKIGIVRELNVPVLNSGMIVFPKNLMQTLCTVWNDRYEKKIAAGFTGKAGTWDQDILNDIINEFPHVELPSKYNHIIKDYTPEQEIKMFDEVKIFHFLHYPELDRTKYRSYQTFIK